MVIINLTVQEMSIATNVAMLRQVYNWENGAKHRHGKIDDDWESIVTGCICEIALAKHLGRFWPGPLGDYDAPDVAPCYEIRGTKYSEGRLILHPDDNDFWPHTVGRLNRMSVTLAGWAYGYEVKQQKFWKELRPDRPAFVADNGLLRDMETLPDPWEVLDLK